MSVLFPTMLYRSPGPHSKPSGGTYSYTGAKTQEEFDEKLAAGWLPSSAEAVTAAGDKATTPKKIADWRIKLKAKKTKKRKPSRPLGGKPLDAVIKPAINVAINVEIDAVSEPAFEDAPPTRPELEAKATELGIRFDGRTRDKKLGQSIQDRLAEPTTEPTTGPTTGE
jgi:hypothetical protein